MTNADANLAAELPVAQSHDCIFAGFSRNLLGDIHA